jgi:alkanesulfonate monooxygenase SsuD/methylene tetrahydromethanopterin reductase-like flavin-dependent oxidoreductase (luciferase family)
MSFQGVGVQLTPQLNAEKNTVPALVEQAAYARELGFDQVWHPDGLGSRSQLVVLSAIGAKVPMNLGTAILCPYFRHPLDIAGALASISELIAPHELSVGLARGPFGSHLRRPVKPITMLRETAQFLKRALAGERVKYADFPMLASYFHINPEESARVRFRPKGPVLLYTGGNAPKSIAVGGKYMDGVLFGGHFLALHKAGRVRPRMEIAEAAAKEADPNKRLRKVAEIHVSVSADAKAARNHPKEHIIHELSTLAEMGVSDEDFEELGIKLEERMRIKEAVPARMTAAEAANLVTDAMIDATFIAGDMESSRARILEACQAAASYGFERISFGKLGPDHNEALKLLSDLLPTLKSK